MKIELFLRHLVVTLEGMEKEYEMGYNNGYFSVEEVLAEQNVLFIFNSPYIRPDRREKLSCNVPMALLPSIKSVR